MVLVCGVKNFGYCVRFGSRDRKRDENKEFCLDMVYFLLIVFFSYIFDFYYILRKKGAIAVDCT